MSVGNVLSNFFYCRLLEVYLPHFFKGAIQAFRNRSKRDGEGKVIDEYRENSTNRPDITEEAKKSSELTLPIYK